MRFGCLGCLALIVVAVILVAFGLGMVFLSINIFGTPETRAVTFSKADGYSAQQKLYETILRQSGRSSRKDPIVLTEREANAFLARHLAEVAGVPLSPLTVRLQRGEAVVQGQTVFRNLLQNPILARIAPYLPDRRLDQPVWVTLRGYVSLEPPSGASRYGTLTVTGLELGRQPLSSFILVVLMGPSGGGLLRWRVPATVESVQIEDGHLVIRTR